MSNKELLKELRQKYNDFKSVSGMNCDFETFDKIFFLSESTLSMGYVYKDISKQLFFRILDFYNPYISQLHEWVMPNPSSMIRMTETKALTDDDRKEITKFLERFMALISQQHLRYSDDAKKIGVFIDEAVDFYAVAEEKSVFYHKKLHEYWKKQVEK